MSDDDIISSDNPFSRDQQKCLTALLKILIPAEGRMPGADEVSFPEFLQEQRPDAIPQVQQILDELTEQLAPVAAEELVPEQLQDLVEQLETNQAAQLQLLLSQLYACYYQHDDVLVALGLEPGPPFPRGNTVEQGDLSLLDPVRKRGTIYRVV